MKSVADLDLAIAAAERRCLTLRGEALAILYARNKARGHGYAHAELCERARGLLHDLGRCHLELDALRLERGREKSLMRAAEVEIDRYLGAR